MPVEPVLQLAPGAATPKVLIVDDAADNRLILIRLLQPSGFEVREAEDGIEAVEISEQWRPDAVLMDLQMPRLDGCSATRQIKNATWGLKIAVIIVSGANGDTLVSDALSAGALAFIAKPFVGAEILAALGAALNLEYA